MTARERNLALVLLVLVVLLGLGFVFKVFILDPSVALKATSDARNVENRKLEKEISEEMDALASIKKFSPRLAFWQRLSLPTSTGDTSAKNRHLSDLSSEYRLFLSRLAKDADFKPDKDNEAEVSVVELKDRDRADIETNDNRVPLYKPIAFTVEAHAPFAARGRDGRLTGVQGFLVEFYKAPILHQIRDLQTTYIESKRTLKVKIVAEAMVVEGAETLKQRGSVFAQWKEKEKPPTVLAFTDKQYEELAGRHLFAPPPPPTIAEGPMEERTPRNSDDAETVLSYTKLTMIGHSDYYNTWIAQIHDYSKKDYSTAVLTDRALPKESRFQQDVASFQKDVAAGKKKKDDVAPVEPARRWEAKDRRNETFYFHDVPISLEIVRIEPLGVIFQTGGDLYSLPLGGNILSALEDPLDAAALKKLGLKNDPREILAKVKLDKLEFDNEYKIYIGHFVNEARDNEKRKLRYETIEDLSWDSKDSDWTLKDKLGVDMAKIRVVKSDKDHIWFVSDNKYYAVKQGETLAKAMEKSLEEKEWKELKLPALKNDPGESPGESLAKIKLDKLEFDKDFNVYVGHFVNEARDNEKRKLRYETNDDLNWDAKDSDWTLKDKLGVEMAKIRVVKSDKDHVWFLSDKKYYAVKPGETLAKAMEKALEETEWKELKLPAPK